MLVQLVRVCARAPIAQLGLVLCSSQSVWLYICLRPVCVYALCGLCVYVCATSLAAYLRLAVQTVLMSAYTACYATCLCTPLRLVCVRLYGLSVYACATSLAAYVCLCGKLSDRLRTPPAV